jgi:hypothetical protein
VPVVQGGKVSDSFSFLSCFGGRGGSCGIGAWWADVSGQVVAIIDIDCAELNGFDEEDQVALEELAELLAQSCDF